MKTLGLSNRVHSCPAARQPHIDYLISIEGYEIPRRVPVGSLSFVHHLQGESKIPTWRSVSLLAPLLSPSIAASTSQSTIRGPPQLISLPHK
ncbi:hypothetical protein ACU8KH_04960 [Lachancea thermotolerans]